MFSNSLPIIEIHNTGHALKKKTNLTGWYARVNWHCFAKIVRITAVGPGAKTDLKRIWGGVDNLLPTEGIYLPFIKN